MKVVCISCFNSFHLHVSKFIEYFSDLNCEVKYIVQDFSHAKKIKSPFEYPGVDVINIHVPEYKNNLSVKRLYSHYIFGKKIYKFLCEFKPDIIYCMFPPNILVREVSKYKKNYAAKVIFDFWDSWPESLPFKDKKYYMILKPFLNYWKNLRENYIHNADLLLTVSKTGLENVKQKYPDIESHVLRPSRKTLKPEDLPKYDFSNVSHELSFCYLGNVNYITDINFALKLFSELTKHKKISLHIIGEGNNLESFVRDSESKGVKVFTHGIVFDDYKKCEIFSQCHMGLSIPKPEINSTMPLKATEYIRAGMPVISTSSGDIHDLIQNYNFGINSQNPYELADILSNITTQELENINNSCVENYKNAFTQDLSGILKNIL